MKAKKLGVMRINDDVLNPAMVLSRDEMKSILAGSGSGTCSCRSDDGCGVAMGWNSSGWTMSVSCDGHLERYSGSGPYGGTACNGRCP